MKFNEPVRPAGIGRRQVAFDTGRKPSALTLIENEDNSSLDPQSNEAQNVATLANAGAQARAIAYSAASSAIMKGMNDVWGTRYIDNFLVANLPSSQTAFGYVKWANEGSLWRDWGSLYINNNAMYIDSEDTSKIRTNKPGWWLIDCMVNVTNYKTSSNYELHIFGGDIYNYQYESVGYDIVHTNQYPTLRVNGLLPLPSVINPYGAGGNDIDKIITNDPYFRIGLYFIDNANQDITVEANGYIQATFIRPFYEYETSTG